MQAKSKPNRRAAERRGRRAEYLAALTLILKGYRIRAMRYKTKFGEVDIIAQRGTLVLLVEVKARPNLMQAHDAISSASAQRIEAAGDLWLSKQQRHADISVRRDLIAVLPRRWPIHVENAF